MHDKKVFLDWDKKDFVVKYMWNFTTHITVKETWLTKYNPAFPVLSWPQLSSFLLEGDTLPSWQIPLKLFT